MNDGTHVQTSTTSGTIGRHRGQPSASASAGGIRRTHRTGAAASMRGEAYAALAAHMRAVRPPASRSTIAHTHGDHQPAAPPIVIKGSHRLMGVRLACGWQQRHMPRSHTAVSNAYRASHAEAVAHTPALRLQASRGSMSSIASCDGARIPLSMATQRHRRPPPRAAAQAWESACGLRGARRFHPQ